MRLTAALSVALTLLIAAPVLQRAPTRVFGFELAGRHHDPFTMMAQYESGGPPAPYFQPATDLPGMSLARLAGGVHAYNALVLLSIPLTAIVAYLHAWHVTGSTVAAGFAALVFALSPFHLAHAAYHVHIAQIQWIPLFFLSLWRLIERPGPLRAALTAGALLIAGASSFYLGFVVAVAAPVAAVGYAWVRRTRSSPRAALGWTVAALAAPAALVLVAVWWRAPELVANPQAFAFPGAALDQHSARWWSYVIPPAGHPWLGDMSRRTFAASGITQGVLEQQVSLGVSVVALAIVGLVAARSRHDSRLADLAPVMAATAVFALCCSLPAPAGWLFELAPVFRSYARFGAIVSLMITTLAGAGVAYLLQLGSRASVAAAMVLMAAAVFEYFPPLPIWRDVLPTPAHRALADVDGALLLDCTAQEPGATAGVDWLMRGDVRFAVGPFADCGEPELGSKLAAFRFTHLLVRRDADAAAWFAAGRVPDGVRAITVSPEAWTFAVTAPSPPLYARDLTGFYAREHLGADSWRWMGPRGSFALVNVTNAPVTASLDVELESFVRERRIAVDLDGSPQTPIVAGPKPASYRIGPMRVPIGSHALTLQSDATLVPAGTIERSEDNRPLSVRVRGWRWEFASPARITDTPRE